MKYPRYRVHWKTGHGELLEEYTFLTPICSAFSVSTRHISLNRNGELYLAPGYVWDFGSGPAVDTPDMVLASLAHDAFYELMVLGHLPWTNRKKVDRYFLQLLKSFNMPWWRRAWVYLGVRVGYPVLKFFDKLGAGPTSYS